MSNELNNIICKNSDGVCEGVAIGGDAYPGSRFVDHLLRYENNEDCKILVLLGEVGGADEYDVCEAITSGRITKPLIAWCIGTCASAFSFEVQFGHAGACARGRGEAALEKIKLWPRRVPSCLGHSRSSAMRSRRCMRVGFKRYYHT